MWFESLYTGVIVKFTGRQTWEIVKTTKKCSYKIGDKTSCGIPHTDKKVWKQAEEPMEYFKHGKYEYKGNTYNTLSAGTANNGLVKMKDPASKEWKLSVIYCKENELSGDIYVRELEDFSKKFTHK